MPSKPIETDGFVRIRTLFDELSERSVDSLQSCYADHSALVNELQKLTASNINKSNLCGKRVLIKPNWVNHTRLALEHLCLRTHESLILAFLDVVLACDPIHVVIGDAPIQGCNWEKMIDMDFAEAVKRVSGRTGIPVEIKDFRRKVMNLSTDDMVAVRQSIDDFLIFDVGKESYLEPITTTGENRFRVTHYNPDRFLESHASGMHKYCITRELFRADVVISMPKVKTHEKSGVTNALKNIVGLNGDKDFLPHHRIGGTKSGGDSYPGNNWLRNWSERCYDQGNRNLGKSSYWFWVRVASLLWKLSKPGPMDRFGAGWHGNDTTWRMVMDLNLIVNYGKEDGTLAETPQRVLYSLCDGIIAGQKDGPLKPSPLELGVLCFTNDSSWADICMATLMGMEVQRLPLLMAAKEFSAFRKIEITLNGKNIQLEALKKLAITAEMPAGWINYSKT